MHPDVRTAVLVIATVVIAGCTSPLGGQDDTESVVTQNDGLSIRFGPATDVFTTGEPIVLEMTAENTGSAEASFTRVATTGPTFVRDHGSNALCTGRQTPSERSLRVNNLEGAITATDQPGGSVVVTWRCPFPGDDIDIAAGETRTWPIGVNVTYRYRTNATASVTVVPRSRFDGATSTAPTDNTAGPVHAEMAIATPHPDGLGLDFPVTIRNTGDGTVVDLAIDSMSILGTDKAIHCKDRAMGEQDRVPVTLVDGSRTIRCETGGLSGDVEREYTVRMELVYAYREQVSSTLRVRGTR